MVEPRRRHAVRETRKVRRQIGLDRAAEIVDAERRVAAGDDRRRRQFAVDDGRGDDVLRVERGKPSREIFQFADVAGPTVLFQPLQRL